MLAKRKPAPSLAQQIEDLRADVEAFLQKKAHEVKSSRDGSALPLEAIMNMITRGYMGRCPCQAAMVVIEDFGE
jgi:hypothetical protein